MRARAHSLYNCCLNNVCGHSVNVTYNCFPIRFFHSFHSFSHSSHSPLARRHLNRMKILHKCLHWIIYSANKFDRGFSRRNWDEKIEYNSFSLSIHHPMPSVGEMEGGERSIRCWSDTLLIIIEYCQSAISADVARGRSIFEIHFFQCLNEFRYEVCVGNDDRHGYQQSAENTHRRGGGHATCDDVFHFSSFLS